MDITEVRIKLVEESGERLLAYCSVIFDGSFVVRDVKIIDGSSGPFVAMPSRKLTAHCPHCHNKNHLRAAYCNQCGTKLKENTFAKDGTGRVKLFADIAHPINAAAREAIQAKVIEAYEEELTRAKLPGYTPRDDIFFPEDAIPEIPQHFGHDDHPNAPHVQKRDSGATSDVHPSIPKRETDNFGRGLFE